MAMPDDLTTLICLFHDEDQAQAAYKDLQAAGFASGSITVVGGNTADAQPGSKESLATIGVPERDQDHLFSGLQDGGVLLSVSAFGPEQKKVEDIFTAHKAAKIDDQRTDDYMNYKKYKPETQETPMPLATTTSAPEQTAPVTDSAAVATVQDGVLVDEDNDVAIPVRVVHLYRRSSDL